MNTKLKALFAKILEKDALMAEIIEWHEDNFKIPSLHQFYGCASTDFIAQYLGATGDNDWLYEKMFIGKSPKGKRERQKHFLAIVDSIIEQGEIIREEDGPSEQVAHALAMEAAADIWRNVPESKGIERLRYEEVAKGLFECGGNVSEDLLTLDCIESSITGESNEYLATVQSGSLSEHITCRGEGPIGAVVRCLEVIKHQRRYHAQAHG